MATRQTVILKDERLSKVVARKAEGRVPCAQQGVRNERVSNAAKKPVLVKLDSLVLLVSLMFIFRAFF